MNIETIQLPAPAKLNLFLHILGQRDDGYHELQTIFQLLDFGDTLSFTPQSDNRISLTPSINGVKDEDNLIVKAARLLQRHTHTPLGAKITLDKRLPMGGGIGGGSSDAATTLLALNHLWNTQVSRKDLAELGRQLGADIPVFVLGHSAWAEGVGEKLIPVDLPDNYYLVLSPPCHVSTASIFTHSELTRDSAAITVAAFFEQATRNDCQTLVSRLYPEVAECIDWLSQHSSSARMTGTGASVFAAFPSRNNAEQVLAQSPWPGFVAQGVNQSPVHSLLAKLV
ncbi:4-(cytidine 5'-diphospho)-2-C-methyl-D-erythritol kinase [Aurantivibrio plasticivorans]